MKRQNRAIEILLKEYRKTTSIKEHNNRIENELPLKQEKWRNEGLNEADVVYRSIRLYGDELIHFDEELHKDLEGVLKYLGVEV